MTIYEAIAVLEDAAAAVAYPFEADSELINEIVNDLGEAARAAVAVVRTFREECVVEPFDTDAPMAWIGRHPSGMVMAITGSYDGVDAVHLFSSREQAEQEL